MALQIILSVSKHHLLLASHPHSVKRGQFREILTATSPGAIVEYLQNGSMMPRSVHQKQGLTEGGSRVSQLHSCQEGVWD